MMLHGRELDMAVEAALGNTAWIKCAKCGREDIHTTSDDRKVAYCPGCRGIAETGHVARRFHSDMQLAMKLLLHLTANGFNVQIDETKITICNLDEQLVFHSPDQLGTAIAQIFLRTKS